MRHSAASVSHLCMAASSQGLAAPLAAQTWPVPVLPQRRHLLSCTQTQTTMETVTTATSRLKTRSNAQRCGDMSDMRTQICSPKYTVLLHLGQMLGPPEKDEKLAAGRLICINPWWYLTTNVSLNKSFYTQSSSLLSDDSFAIFTPHFSPHPSPVPVRGLFSLLLVWHQFPWKRLQGLH